MKNRIKIYFGIALLAATVSSCNLDKEPLNGPATGTFPSNETEAENGLLGAYKALTLLDASSTPFLHVLDNITDIGYARPGNNYTPGITSSYTTDNTLATKPWTAHYKTLARVHLVLDKLPGLQGKIPPEKLKQLDAELRFIRAYVYSQLIELYGGVPLLTKNVPLGEANIAKTDAAEIRQWIIEELTAIADALPVNQSAYGKVRASSVAAYMLKARVALYAGQFDLAAASADQGIKLSNGLHELTPFNESINYAGKSHVAGEPDVSNIFGHEGFKSSKEWIWVMEYNINVPGNVHNQQYYAASRLGRGVAYWGPTQDFIDSFQASDGLSITESTEYDASNPFANRDPRLDMYCVRPGSRFLGYQFEMNSSFKNVLNYWPVLSSASDEPSTVANADQSNAARSYSGYLWRKHVDIKDFATTSVNGQSDLNIGIFRYAELLLIYAEAKIEANKIDNSVYDAINQIRLRAHMPVLKAGLSQAELRKALRYERKVELASDGFRWYDLRRWGIANQILNGNLYLNRDANKWTSAVLTKIDDNASPVYNTALANKVFGVQNVIFKINKDEFWPIPESEIVMVPNLKQNPGY